MSLTSEEVQLRSFVLVRLGNRKVAVSAETVIELVAPTKEQQFPHSTPWLSKVIIRRGRIIPVCDVGSLLGETSIQPSSYHLVVELHYVDSRDWYAIPVRGECELLTPESIVPVHDRPEYVTGLFSLGEEQIEILDVAKLIQFQESTFARTLAEHQS